VLVRLASLFRQAGDGSESSNFSALAECISDYLLNRR
jgi:hypothetical protein